MAILYSGTSQCVVDTIGTTYCGFTKQVLLLSVQIMGVVSTERFICIA